MHREKCDFPWAAATVGASCFVVAAIYLVSVSNPARVDLTAIAHSAESAITLVPLGAAEGGVDVGATAELTLLDPTPLFLPTIYNSGKVDRSMTTERSPGASFGEIEPKMVFMQADSQLVVPDVVHLPNSPLNAMQDLSPPITFNELSRRDANLSRLAGRAAIIEVKRISDGAVVWNGTVDTEILRDTDLVPIEMMVVVDSSGFITERGALSVAVAGGAAPVFGEQQVDLAATTELLRKVALGRRLGAGIYRISLGP